VLNQYVYTAEEFHTYASELFEIVKQGHLKLAVHEEYPLTTEGIKQSQIDISTFTLTSSVDRLGVSYGKETNDRI